MLYEIVRGDAIVFDIVTADATTDTTRLAGPKTFPTNALLPTPAEFAPLDTVETTLAVA
jgi:hypothetical protein